MVSLSVMLPRILILFHILNTPAREWVGSGRVEHTLHELLNHLLDYSDEAKSVLDELRNACNLSDDIISSKLRIIF